MPKEISLKLCLLNSIVETPREEFQDQLLVGEPKSNCKAYQGPSQDERDFLPTGVVTWRDSEELS